MNSVQEYILANEQVVETNLPWEVARQLCNLLAVHFKKDFYLVTWSNDRDTSTYYIKPSTKIKKAEIHDAQIFAKGARAAWR
jgi:hypothetical protein